MEARITVLPGDGVGPEVTAEAVAALKVVAERFGHTFEFQDALIGGAAVIPGTNPAWSAFTTMNATQVGLVWTF